MPGCEVQRVSAIGCEYRKIESFTGCACLGDQRRGIDLAIYRQIQGEVGGFTEFPQCSDGRSECRCCLQTLCGIEITAPVAQFAAQLFA